MVFNRFDAYLEDVLRAAYERGDQAYRNAAKLLAGCFAELLAVAGGWIVHANHHHDVFSASYVIGSPEFAFALVLGAVAVPLAPIAKDLATALQTTVKTMRDPAA